MYLLGSGNYDPDTFSMTINSPVLLKGQNRDSGGAGGTMVMTRK